MCLWMLLPTGKNVAFHFSGIKRKLLELYWSQTLCLLECLWLVCSSGAMAAPGSRQEFMEFHSASAVAPVAVPAAFKPLGLVTGFAPDLQVASVLSQGGCAGPAVPFPRGCSEQALGTNLPWGCVLTPPQNWAVGWKAWRGQMFLFSLRKADQSEGAARSPGVRAAQPWELGKLPSLIKLKSYTEKRCFPFEIVDSLSPFLQSGRVRTKVSPETNCSCLPVKIIHGNNKEFHNEGSFKSHLGKYTNIHCIAPEGN